MISKIKSTAANNTVAQNVLHATHRIWLAGLGAFATVQAEGSKVLNDLTKEGASVEAKGLRFANDGIEKAIATTTEVAAKVRGAYQTRIVEPVRQRLGLGAATLGLPARQDIVALTRRVEELSAQVRALRA